MYLTHVLSSLLITFVCKTGLKIVSLDVLGKKEIFSGAIEITHFICSSFFIKYCCHELLSSVAWFGDR